jgi:hypothetical protein
MCCAAQFNYFFKYEKRFHCCILTLRLENLEKVLNFKILFISLEKVLNLIEIMKKSGKGLAFCNYVSIINVDNLFTHR